MILAKNIWSIWPKIFGQFDPNSHKEVRKVINRFSVILCFPYGPFDPLILPQKCRNFFSAKTPTLIKMGISLSPDNIFGSFKNLKSSTFHGEYILQAIIGQFCQILGAHSLWFSKTVNFDTKKLVFWRKMAENAKNSA